MPAGRWRHAAAGGGVGMVADGHRAGRLGRCHRRQRSRRGGDGPRGAFPRSRSRHARRPRGSAGQRVHRCAPGGVRRARRRLYAGQDRDRGAQPDRPGRVRDARQRRYTDRRGGAAAAGRGWRAGGRFLHRRRAVASRCGPGHQLPCQLLAGSGRGARGCARRGASATRHLRVRPERRLRHGRCGGSAAGAGAPTRRRRNPQVAGRHPRSGWRTAAAQWTGAGRRVPAQHLRLARWLRLAQGLGATQRRRLPTGGHRGDLQRGGQVCCGRQDHRQEGRGCSPRCPSPPPTRCAGNSPRHASRTAW